MPDLRSSLDPALQPYAERARAKMTDAEFARRIEEARVAFDGLLDDEALALLVLDEAGLNEGAFVELADLQGRAEASVRVVVERVEGVREFAREGRAPGRVCNVVVRDDSGEARVVLWDRDVEKAEDGTLHPGAKVTLVGARVKESRFGPELHVTPWTAIEVEGALDPAKRKLLADVAGDVDPLALALRGVERDLRPRQTTLDAPGPLRGALASVAPTRPFRRADGSLGFVCEAEFDTGDGRVRVVCWDEAVKAVRALAVGDEVEVEGLVAKAKGGAAEWHTASGTRFRRPKQPE
jgi:replication factor A1